MIPIFIPSRKRAHLLKSEFCPIRQMNDQQRSHVIYVVPDGDEIEYEFDLPPCVKVLGFRGTLPQKRKFFGEYAAERGWPKFMAVDDDVKWFKRDQFWKTNLVPASSFDLDLMFRVVDKYLENGYAHVGISAREGNNRAGEGDPYTLYEENTRLLRAHAFWTDIYNSVEHDRVMFVEDFDIALQILEKGYKNCNLFFWSQDQRSTQDAGGYSDTRNVQNHEEALKRLSELHPGVVKLRQKENKTGGEFGKRTEVTIQWKKAYEMSDKPREASAPTGESGAGMPLFEEQSVRTEVSDDHQTSDHLDLEVEDVPDTDDQEELREMPEESV